MLFRSFQSINGNATLDLANGSTLQDVIHYYRFRPALGATSSGFFANHTPFDAVFVKSGSIFVVRTQVIAGLPSVEGAFTLFYNSLAEWQTFREPTFARNLR